MAGAVRERLARDANDVDALFVLAAMRARDGKIEEGISILDRVLRIDPTYPGAWRFKAKLHRMRGETDDETEARRKAEEAEP